MRHLFVSVFSLSFLFFVNSASASETRPLEDLATMVATALSNNPELKASNARWEMFRSRIDQARALEDPMLMLKLQNWMVDEPFNSRVDPMTQRVIGISQQLPFWGKRDLRGEIASREAESYKWGVAERKLELVRMVKETWYRIYYVDRSLEIVDKNIKILDDFITLAETKYSVGQGVQQDVYKAQVERSRMLDMRITLEQQRKTLQANLNALLYRPADTPVAGIPDIEISPVSLSGKELKERASDNRPLIKGLEALIGKGDAGLKLARKENYPDFNLSFEYMQRDPIGEEQGNDMYSAGITFNLPVQRARRRAMVAEAESEKTMAAEELKALRNTIDSGVEDLLAQLDRRKKLVELYKTGIIPQAAQSLESAVIGYRVGKVDFLTLLDSRVTLFNYERE
ncbi:MAG: TolC family protein, partial [Deltaproteobacteria bacterium]|nr:TolC family protein [Deltaproteobacteria bacterium]